MKTQLMLLLSTLACAVASAELTPRQVEAKRSLEETAQMEEYRGSIFAQARLDGIDYRPLLKRATNLDKGAMISLFKMKFIGEGAETHCSILRDLMTLWGDAKFSELLGPQPKDVRALVVSSIDYSWSESDWASHTKTLGTSPDSITQRTSAEQDSAGNGGDRR